MRMADWPIDQQLHGGSTVHVLSSAYAHSWNWWHVSADHLESSNSEQMWDDCNLSCLLHSFIETSVINAIELCGVDLGSHSWGFPFRHRAVKTPTRVFNRWIATRQKWESYEIKQCWAYKSKIRYRMEVSVAACSQLYLKARSSHHWQLWSMQQQTRRGQALT